MDKQALIRFLQEEAERATKDVFPAILKELELRFVPGVSCAVPIDGLISNYPENIQTLISSKIVRRLEGLGYEAHSRRTENSMEVVVS